MRPRIPTAPEALQSRIASDPRPPQTPIPADSGESFLVRKGPSRTQQLGLLVVLALLTALAVVRVLSGG